MTKRTYVRILSYFCFLMTIIITTAIINTNDMNGYKQQLEISYQQSLTELNECLDTINTDLTKSIYSNSYGEIYDLSRDLYAQCATAKNAISRLPVKQMQLNSTYKFLSQAADYAQYIGQKAEAGKQISNDEHKALRTLLNYSEKLCSQTDSMVGLIEAGARITDSEIRLKNDVETNAISTSFSQSAKTFEDFPTLIYDGPFSDQVLNKSSKLVQGSKVYKKSKCKALAAKALGMSSQKLSYVGDDKSKLPSFNYKYGRQTISVTKQGGYIKEILYSGEIAKSKIDEKRACSLAEKYLENIGYKNMRSSYYETKDNICTINCVYTNKNVYYYSDIIKVSVSLYDGQIIALDSKTYLTNHIDRTQKKAKISEDKARALVSKYLEIKGVKKAVIPKESGNEVECYEFACLSKDTGEQALVYINTQNGREEDILLIVKTNNSTLVK